MAEADPEAQADPEAPTYPEVTETEIEKRELDTVVTALKKEINRWEGMARKDPELTQPMAHFLQVVQKKVHQKFDHIMN